MLVDTDVASPEYRAEKLKAKIIKHELGQKIYSTSYEDHGKFTSQLVFSNSLKVQDAVKLAYTLGTNDSIAHVAYTLRDVIRIAFITSDSIPWPPSADHLQRNNDIVPKELESFLKIVFGARLNLTVCELIEWSCQ